LRHDLKIFGGAIAGGANTVLASQPALATHDAI
jgi:hypothetical protein